jgi:hypothetical protein
MSVDTGEVEVSVDVEVFKSKKLGKKSYIYDTTLPALAEKVAKEHNIDIADTKIEFALVDPMISKDVAGRCRLVYDEYTLLTEVNYMITFSNELWKRLTPVQRELLVCHELMHIAKVTDAKTGILSRFMLARHDLEDFSYLVGKYGVNWLSYVEETKLMMIQIQKDKEDAAREKREKKEEKAKE